jgi:hypothetical protein
VASETGEEASFVFAGEFVLPDAEDAPAGAAEGAGDETVAGLVAGNLGLPEFRIGLGLRGVDRAAVRSERFPEATAFVVDYGTVGLNGHGDDVFIHGNRVIEIALTVQELLKSCHHEVRNLALRFGFGGENTGPIFVLRDRECRALEKGFCVDAKTTPWSRS